ncbi:hypothetical protein [Methanoplanus endosymbiosus]|uniref:Uncharacterized protein n=1 Tax=Methanoplanus endosymbiosus TaxID=33865 RepID=A0A9E7PQY9_9EURY|nr:hypothetical protein [Methanoplanus endosymbiosus]UUX93231.1 hypothetical protein L6E24_03660 [Methanoplanus endosymbiosus]
MKFNKIGILTGLNVVVKNYPVRLQIDFFKNFEMLIKNQSTNYQLHIVPNQKMAMKIFCAEQREFAALALLKEFLLVADEWPGVRGDFARLGLEVSERNHLIFAIDRNFNFDTVKKRVRFPDEIKSLPEDAFCVKGSCLPQF